MNRNAGMTRVARSWSISLAVSTALLLISPAANALKWAEPSHNLQPDRRLPKWQPAPLEVEPEEALNVVGADVMDEMTLGWVKLMRRAYPLLSVTMEARASGTGGPALTEGIAHIATVGRELLPAEEQAFVARYGYAPTAFRVATGSVGSLGKTAASIVMVDRDNPIKCLSLPQLDAIYSSQPKRGLSPIRTWGDLGLSGGWAQQPIRLYGLKHPNGIEWYFRQVVMNGGPYRDDIEFVKGRGHVHAFNVAAEKMAEKSGGLTYAAGEHPKKYPACCAFNADRWCVRAANYAHRLRPLVPAEPIRVCLRQRCARKEARAKGARIRPRGVEFRGAETSRR